MSNLNDIKLSIRVLSYNQERYISQTLDSILNQEHPYPYEIIVCDDASQDSTPRIIAEYASRYKEIVPVLRKRNIGLIANYFDAVSRCKGEYMMGCAGDDYWLPDKVYKQIKFMDSHPDVGLCYGDAIKINENGERIGVWKGRENNTFESFLKSNSVPACSICQRSSVVEKYIAEINPNSKSWKMEDYPLLLWFSLKSKIQYLPEEIVAYRVLEESASHSRSSSKTILFFQNVNEIRSYFVNRYHPKYEKSKIEYSHLSDLIQFLPSSSDDYKKACLQQLDKCKLTFLKKIILKLRIKYDDINKAYLKYSYFKQKLSI